MGRLATLAKRLRLARAALKHFAGRGATGRRAGRDLPGGRDPARIRSTRKRQSRRTPKPGAPVQPSAPQPASSSRARTRGGEGREGGWIRAWGLLERARTGGRQPVRSSRLEGLSEPRGMGRSKPGDRRRKRFLEKSRNWRPSPSDESLRWRNLRLNAKRDLHRRAVPNPTDERGWETERCRMAQATAPILDSTDADLPRCPPFALLLGPKLTLSDWIKR
jgi:hypothetical protein